MTSITPSPEMVERAARAMEPSAFNRFDDGYTNRNRRDERAFLNAERTVKSARRKAKAALTAALSCPDGFRLVPVEPTPEMVRCGEDALRKSGSGLSQLDGRKAADRIYRAMLAASPAPAGSGDWQPIASAPTSGDILVFCDDTQEMFVAYHTRSIDTGEVGWTYARFRHHHGGIASVLCKPTHWQPLPSAPSQDAPPPRSLSNKD